SRHDDLAELDVAGRAPGEHAGRASAGESGYRVAADSPRGLCITGTELNDTAAVCRTAEDFVARAEPIQDFQAEECDVGGLEHVAAEIHDNVGCGPGVSAG